MQRAIFRQLTIGAFVLATVGPASAQDSIRVAVAIDDRTGGLFQSAFASAFRRLGDVTVISHAERPDYVLAGVVLCLGGSCPEAAGYTGAGYTAALRFYEPATRSFGRYIVDLVVERVGAHPPRSIVDSLYKTVWEMYADYEQSHMNWVVRWGQTHIEQETQGLVSQIDTQCFDKIRAAHRIRRDTPFRPDTPYERMERYQAYLASRVWIC